MTNLKRDFPEVWSSIHHELGHAVVGLRSPNLPDPDAVYVAFPGQPITYADGYQPRGVTFSAEMDAAEKLSEERLLDIAKQAFAGTAAEAIARQVGDVRCTSREPTLGGNDARVCKFTVDQNARADRPAFQARAMALCELELRADWQLIREAANVMGRTHGYLTGELLADIARTTPRKPCIDALPDGHIERLLDLASPPKRPARQQAKASKKVPRRVKRAPRFAQIIPGSTG